MRSSETSRVWYTATVLRNDKPMVRKENMVTDRTIEGARLAMMAKVHSAVIMSIALLNVPFLELGMGFNKKVINSMMKPTCRPDTDSTCMAPAYW